ncbi:alpha-ketoglutarate-dependent dioxygenase AlkB [Solimonas soli]|uniref:alpha-ketoglutarate-dependent dioxygenase AlkB n=1 Tax=Solimonas soli TaxID=413479 RepID=UPI0004B8FC77|nr:alpha-ketoglutarate-dependent dioxygenase AlkB [Solimonas soli]
MSPSQAGLFEPAELLIRDDAEGGIRYFPGFVPPALAERWFVSLREGVDWRRERRQMYEREVDVPRLVARYALADAQLPDALRELAACVAARVAAPFNSIGLNHYRDGADSVALHHDKLHELVPGQPIALVSLGAARRMEIRTAGRAVATPRRRWPLVLEAGSLLLMSHRSQLETEHGIPKTREPVGARISVALRVRPRGSA